MSSTPKSRIGLVVIGRNEGDRLLTCLQSTIRQLSPQQVVYVDFGSIDGSLERARDFGVQTVALDPAQPFTAARARNAGVERLRAVRPRLEFIQFVDGDCELVGGWIEKALKFLDECQTAAVVCGRCRERYPDRSLYNWLCDQEWHRPIGEALACGGNALVRVCAFEQAGGYRSGLQAGEEPELCLRLRERGWKIWRLDTEMTIYDANLIRFAQWWRRTARGGQAYAEVYQIHRSSPLRIWQKENLRVIFWAGILPLVILIGGLLKSFAFAGLLLYPAQIVRISVRRGVARAESWAFATFMVLAKFAELQGMICYYLSALQKRIASRRSANVI